MRESKILLKAGKACKIGRKILHTITNMLLLLLLLFSIYALYDNWNIFRGTAVGDDMLVFKPQIDTAQEVVNPSINDLIDKYPDARAWITIDETKIDYPVVQGEDNLEYVNTNIDGEFSLSGAIFLDYKNTKDFSDLYNILHGHFMDLGVMFSDLKLFASQDFLNKNSTGTLYLPNKTVELEIFAYLSASAYDPIFYSPNQNNIETQEQKLSEIKKRASAYREIDLSSDDQIIALSTCDFYGTDSRILVFAKMLKNN